MLRSIAREWGADGYRYDEIPIDIWWSVATIDRYGLFLVHRTCSAKKAREGWYTDASEIDSDVCGGCHHKMSEEALTLFRLMEL